MSDKSSNEKATRVFEALAHTKRREALRVLVRHGSATATGLAEELDLSRQAVAKHFGTLRRAGLVRAKRQGREIRFELLPENLAVAHRWISRLELEWEARLQLLKALVETAES